MNTVIDYQHVNIRQGKHLVLSDVCLQVEQGEMVYLTGQVGSGKSSLLKTLYGELPMEGDEARILDCDLLNVRPSQLPNLRRQLGIVFQDFQLLPDRTVRHNLDFVLRATDWDDETQRNERISQALDIVRLSEKVDSQVYELSGGEQQRICIARALLNAPRIILADEPTGNLDAENGECVMALLDEIRRQTKTTVVVSTHNMQWLEYFPGTVYCCGGKDKNLSKK